ncbi:MAG TPA: DUF58 domain-containing protein, partial [Acidimicrobiales bacterium]|nr:DUF58 domain-containing protein [Acidimicrobiales bacterium]
GSVIYVRYQPFQVETHREVRPAQVHANGRSRVELSVRNVDGRRSPVLSARDPFDGGRRWARFSVAPLAPGETVRAAYRLPTSERGIFPLGPLLIGLTDPFGLAQRTTQAAPVATLTVFPRIDSVRPLAATRGADPRGSTGRPAVATGGEDFYALRPYQTGDDLRRVHWSSTARHDELMIRQSELPAHGRMTVLADLRSMAHSPESLELTLSAVASIIHAGWRDHRQVRMVATDGSDTGFGSSAAHLQAILEYLAAADVHAGGNLPSMLAALDRHGMGGGIAVVTTDQLGDDVLVSLNRLSTRFGLVTLVLIERSAWEPGTTRRPSRAVPGGVRLVRVTAEADFPAAWDRVVLASSRRLPASLVDR